MATKAKKKSPAKKKAAPKKKPAKAAKKVAKKAPAKKKPTAPKLPPISQNPHVGKIIGYKKCRARDEGTLREYVLQLEIGPSTARNFPCGVGSKGRAERAKVLKIWHLQGGALKPTTLKKLTHLPYNGPQEYTGFVYELGQVAEPHSYDSSSNDCGAGINFFLDVRKAKNYT